MGEVLHDLNLDNEKRLLRAASDALPAGGALIAIENLIDDARRTSAFGLLLSLDRLNELGDGFDVSGADSAG